MKVPTDWSERLEVENGMICRIVTAYYDKDLKYSEIDVYKERDDGKAFSQNLYTCMYYGYCVAFPGFPINPNANSWYYDTQLAWPFGWTVCNIKPYMRGGRSDVSGEDKELVTSLYPNFKYIFKKYEFRCKEELMRILCMWIKHPEIELMLQAGFYKLAMNGHFYRMSKNNQRTTISFIRKHPEIAHFKFREIRYCMKYSTDKDINTAIHFINLVPSYERSGWTRETSNYYGVIDFNDIRYLENYCAKKKDWEITDRRVIEVYEDYLRLVSNAGKDIHSEYWRYPKDIQKRHDKLLAQLNAKRAADEKIRKARELKEHNNAMKKFNSVVKKYAKFNDTVDGYQIYITSDLQDWQKQADTLHQCILWAKYDEKVGSKKCLIFFIRKDNEPIATAEIKPGKVLGQFYGNEIDRNNCAPSEEVKNIFNKWFNEKLVMKEAI